MKDVYTGTLSGISGHHAWVQLNQLVTLPIGTKVSIEGDIFTVVDTCGTDAIDIFIDHDDGWCGCNLNEYRKVSILTKGGK